MCCLGFNHSCNPCTCAHRLGFLPAVALNLTTQVAPLRQRGATLLFVYRRFFHRGVFLGICVASSRESCYAKPEPMHAKPEASMIAVAGLANLVRIELRPEEEVHFAQQFGPILQYVQQLQGVGTVQLREGVTGLSNKMAPDEPAAKPIGGFDREAALAGFPLRQDDYLVVRAVLGSSEEGAA